ncbi:MAG: metal-dependent hydrolase [Candidatus Heimdallarchaeaceae archaeon]
MPFTLYHIGFAILLIAIFPRLDFVALFLGTVMMDIEPLIYILFGLGELHGVFHSLLGVITLFIPIVCMSKIINMFLESQIGVNVNFSWGYSIFSSLLGLLSHILFDAIIYPEMMFFYPFSQRTGFLFGLWSSRVDYLILVIMAVVGLCIYVIRKPMYKCIRSLKENKRDENKKKEKN